MVTVPLRHLTPALGFRVEGFQAGLGNGVKLRFAIVFCLAPGAAGPAVLLDADKGGIDGALV